jgi:pimeloyl-ACP methyl ester carboxylesterase
MPFDLHVADRDDDVMRQTEFRPALRKIFAMTLTVPATRESFELTMADGTAIHIRRHGNPKGPRLVLCHGNGFAIDAYAPFWSLLTDRYDLVLYDQRNHGQNLRHRLEAHDVPTFVSDMEEIFQAIRRRLGAAPTVGVFHSISAVTSIWHALQYGKRWDALALFDPALIPAPGLPQHDVARTFEVGLAKWSNSRPNHFSDPCELAARFAKSYSLRRWVPGAHELMARSILRQERETGQWSLCCPPACESRVYMTNSALHLTHRIRELLQPLKLICADPDQEDAQAPSKVGRSLHALYGCTYEAIPNTSHLLLIEKPAECARSLLAFLDGQK